MTLVFNEYPNMVYFEAVLYTAPQRLHVVRPFNFFFLFFFLFFLFFFLWPYLQHMEVSGLGVKSELQLLAYATATTTQDLSHVCNLHHSSWQC